MIKYIFSLAITLCSVLYAIAQNQNNSTERTIHVTGSAETSILPDEFEIKISIQEYGKGIFKKSLNDVEEKIDDILEKHKINRDAITFSNKNKNWYYWWRHRYKNKSQKTFTIHLDVSTDLLQLMKDLNTTGVYSVEIASSTNTKLQELRKETKIKAIQAAKEKANFLLTSIDEKVGRAISIREVPNTVNHNWRGNHLASNVKVKSTKDENSIDHIPAIVLRYEINAVFEIM